MLSKLYTRVSIKLLLKTKMLATKSMTNNKKKNKVFCVIKNNFIDVERAGSVSTITNESRFILKWMFKEKKKQTQWKKKIKEMCTHVNHVSSALVRIRETELHFVRSTFACPSSSSLLLFYHFAFVLIRPDVNITLIYGDFEANQNERNIDNVRCFRLLFHFRFVVHEQ